MALHTTEAADVLGPAAINLIAPLTSEDRSIILKRQPWFLVKSSSLIPGTAPPHGSKM